MSGPLVGPWGGALLGLVLGLGVVLLLSGLSSLRPPGLEERLAPYLPGRSADDVASVRAFRAWSAALRRTSSWLDRGLGGSASVRSRLARAGDPVDLLGFRSQQVLCGAVGLVVGAVLSGALRAGRDAPAPALVVMVLAGGAGGTAARDWWLGRQVRERERRLLAELPTVAELLALAVSAGEGAPAALDRVARASRGELGAELRRALAQAQAGASLVPALQGVVARTGLPALARFVDGLVVALERGTPLAEVLQAQAQDARQVGQRALLDAAGRKEIAMMVPVVFGVLPVSVLFAVYPGYAFLQVGW